MGNVLCKCVCVCLNVVFCVFFIVFPFVVDICCVFVCCALCIVFVCCRSFSCCVVVYCVSGLLLGWDGTNGLLWPRDLSRCVVRAC